MVQVVHPVRQSALADAEEKVVVVAHEDVCENVPAASLSDALHGQAEEHPISFLEIDGPLVVSTRDDMMKTRILVPWSSAHAPTVGKADT